MDVSLPLIAGTVSTIFFLSGELPMLHKAFRTRELASYSFGNITIANAGNLVHSVYVYSLPPGPIWMLHTFYLITTALMLVWYLRFEGFPRVSNSSPGTKRDPTHPGHREIPRSNTPIGA